MDHTTTFDLLVITNNAHQCNISKFTSKLLNTKYVHIKIHSKYIMRPSYADVRSMLQIVRHKKRVHGKRHA